jgi:hypothetical protein
VRARSTLGHREHLAFRSLKRAQMKHESEYRDRNYRARVYSVYSRQGPTSPQDVCHTRDWKRRGNVTVTATTAQGHVCTAIGPVDG